MPKTAPLRPSRLSPGPLLTSLAGLLREWLPTQRWFAGKGRPVMDLALLSVTELHPGCLHLLLQAGHAEQAAGSGSDEHSVHDCYQLFLGVGETVPAQPARAVIGRADEGPLAGLMVYDALQDRRSTALLLERLRTPGVVGPLRFERDLGVTLPAGLEPRLLDAEQSNSSLVYGDRYILKVFRRVQPGINPDLEVPWALARQGCDRVPAPVAWIRTSLPWGATLGVLQPFLPDAADGWTRALQALDSGRDFIDEAHELGRATAEVHLALAAAFPLEFQQRHHNGRLAAGMTRRLEAVARSVPELLPHAPALRSAFDALAAVDTPRPAQRIHGDLHLGQVLRTGRRWHLIDFEGEPARPLPNAVVPSRPCVTSRACCGPSTTPRTRVTRGGRTGPGVAGTPTAGAMRTRRAGIRARSPNCSAHTRRTGRCTRSCTRPGTDPSGCRYPWRRSHGLPTGSRWAQGGRSERTCCSPISTPAPPSGARPAPVAPGDRDRLLSGTHHDPHSVLGAHPVPGGVAFRCCARTRCPSPSSPTTCAPSCTTTAPASSPACCRCAPYRTTGCTWPTRARSTRPRTPTASCPRSASWTCTSSTRAGTRSCGRRSAPG